MNEQTYIEIMAVYKKENEHIFVTFAQVPRIKRWTLGDPNRVVYNCPKTYIVDVLDVHEMFEKFVSIKAVLLDTDEESGAKLVGVKGRNGYEFFAIP